MLQSETNHAINTIKKALNTYKANDSKHRHNLQHLKGIDGKGTFKNHFLYFESQGWGEWFINKSFPLILKKLQIPHVKLAGKDVPSNGKIVFEGLFDDIQKIADEVGATAYMSGGMVRAILGYIYQELYHSYEKNAKTWGKLDRFSSQEDFFRPFVSEWIKEHEHLDPTDVLGVGSDFDILIDFPKDTNANTKDTIIKKIEKLINSASIKLGLQNSKSRIKEAFLPYADVNAYHAQTNSTVSQGGSTADWMAFPLKRDKKGEQKIREPEQHKGILKQFVQGYLEYMEQGNDLIGQHHVNLDKQVARGVRPLMEWPFIQLTEESKKTILKEIDQCTGLAYDHDAKKQFSKMLLNARLVAVHNRSTSDQDDILKKIRQNNVKPLHALKPTPLTDKPKLDEEKKRKLIPIDQYLKEYTDEGYVYHGVDSIYAIPKARGAFYVSDSGEGKGTAEGIGLYAAKEPQYSYAGKDGVVMKLKIKHDQNIRIATKDTIETWTNIQTFDWWKETGIDILVDKSRKFSVIVNPAIFDEKSIGETLKQSKNTFLKYGINDPQKRDEIEKMLQENNLKEQDIDKIFRMILQEEKGNLNIELIKKIVDTMQTDEGKKKLDLIENITQNMPDEETINVRLALDSTITGLQLILELQKLEKLGYPIFSNLSNNPFTLEDSNEARNFSKHILNLAKLQDKKYYNVSTLLKFLPIDIDLNNKLELFITIAQKHQIQFDLYHLSENIKYYSIEKMKKLLEQNITKKSDLEDLQEHLWKDDSDLA